jgi:flagellin-like hook-associated protein FlgL
MSSNIALSGGVRNALLSIQQNNGLADIAQKRLATGKKVNSALDNPSSFFTAAGLNARASDLSRLMDAMGLGTKTLEAADNGIKNITKLVETAQGLATQALQTADTATRASLATQFATIMTQIDELADDASFNGTNLIAGTPDNLTVNFNEDASSALTVTGVALDQAGLGIAAAAGSWATDANIQAAVDDLGTALTTLRSNASTFGANLAVVKNRQEFTKSMMSTLNTGADSLILADTDEEAANLLALNTRAQLSQTALTLAVQKDQSVLRLF